MGIKTRASGGFTLIEVALVVIIAGVLLGALAGSYAVYLQSAHAKAVRTNMETVETAIKEFLAVNGRLPCPARITDAPDSATFGVEAAVDCDGPGAAGAGQGAAVAGTFESPAPGAATPTRVRIGMVPVRTLNLPDQYSQDSWKNRYRYAVTEGLATSGSYDPNNGAVSIIDSAGNPALRDAAGNPAFAHYVLISSGPDSVGAYSNSGNTTVACPAAGAAAPLDRENCNEDAIFRKTSAVSTPTGAKHYDDFLTFASSATLQETDCGDHGMLHGINFVGNKDANGCLTDMRIYDNDMVGIGLATGVNPAYLLDVGGSVRLQGASDVPQNTGLVFGSGASAFFSIRRTATNSDLAIDRTAGATTDTPFTIQRLTGNVGIGTTAPNYAFQVRPLGPLVAGGYRSMVIGNDAPNSTMLIIGRGADTASWNEIQAVTTQGASYGDLILERNGGNVGIGTAAPGVKLEVNGAVNATAFNYTSDERLKTNITTLDDSLNKILQLRGVSFHWKKDGTPGIGLIAQEVEKVYPALVLTNPSTGFKSVQYGNLIGPVIEAIKKLYEDITGIHQDLKQMQEKIDAQAGIIAAQDKKIDTLETQMHDLQAQIQELKNDKSGEGTKP